MTSPHDRDRRDSDGFRVRGQEMTRIETKVELGTWCILFAAGLLSTLATNLTASTICRKVLASALLRRQSQLSALRPDLKLLDLRGNVYTRLARLDGDDAIVLACAGLQRLGFDARIRARLDAPQWLPAPAQGAIAIECRDGDIDTLALCAALDDASTRTCVEAEHAINRALHGSCHVPVAAYARFDSDGAIIRAEASGAIDAPDALGIRVAAGMLLAQGARALIDAHL